VCIFPQKDRETITIGRSFCKAGRVVRFGIYFPSITLCGPSQHLRADTRENGQGHDALDGETPVALVARNVLGVQREKAFALVGGHTALVPIIEALALADSEMASVLPIEVLALKEADGGHGGEEERGEDGEE
jgi:hypothetical protein